jgi:Methyltransferase FkbM domain
MLDDFPPRFTCLSLGIGNDVSWDLAMANIGGIVHQYDHTVSDPTTHPNFLFYSIGISGAPSDSKTWATLTEATEKAHLSKINLGILKMDIEGTEWEVLINTPTETLRSFSQIVIEFHGLLRFNEAERKQKGFLALQALRESHTPYHVHANNWGEYGLVDGVPMPDVLEVSLGLNSRFRFRPNNELFPTPLDRPCKTDKPDYYLGRFEY